MLADIGLVLVGLIIGFVIGILVARKMMKKYVEDGNVFDENMVKNMMQSMGRTPSQKQINQVMASMKKANKKK